MTGEVVRYIYLHGFKSSGSSDKVRLLREMTDWWLDAPDIPDRPVDAVPWLEDYLGHICQTYPKDEFVLIGSSLGGYYANWLARKFFCPAALINPLVDIEDLAPMVGSHENYYTGNCFELTQADLDILATLAHDMTITIPRVILLDEGDEVLDYRKAVQLYEHFAFVMKYPYGSHRFDHLEESLPQIESLANTIALW